MDFLVLFVRVHPHFHLGYGILVRKYKNVTSAPTFSLGLWHFSPQVQKRYVLPTFSLGLWHFSQKRYDYRNVFVLAD